MLTLAFGCGIIFGLIKNIGNFGGFDYVNIYGKTC